MSLRPQIDKINTLGRTNLNAKGVTTDGNETTYQLMNMISNIQSGSGETVIISPITCDSNVDSVILPVTLNTVQVQINNKTIIVDSSVSLEE